MQSSLDYSAYIRIVDETLESLCEYFDEVCPDADVTYADGVLTVKLGEPHGTYVINKQVPNRQIWFSSPISGPKRYDFLIDGWYYKRDKTSLHVLLDQEFSSILNSETKFLKCAFASNQTVD
ncbi:Frataxin, mitochondrial [Nymphon striatum]|nr:Frataxin, mitochondrial [Nymphon striatum]